MPRRFYSKSLNCCLEARALVGCSPITAEPCRGFTGDCADLAAQFAGLDISGAPGVPADYVCLQFPNDDSTRDSIILGLISWACSLPVNVLILNCFWCANGPDYDASWLRWDFQRRTLLGRCNWHYRTGDKPESFVRRLYATTWGVNIWYNLQQWAAERPVAWMFERQQRRRARRSEPVIEASSPRGVAMQTEIKMRMFSVVGIVATYIIWAMMSWIIFTYVRRHTHAPPCGQPN